MIFYSMEMHTKCLEELTNLNSFVENFDPEEYEKVFILLKSIYLGTYGISSSR